MNTLTIDPSANRFALDELRLVENAVAGDGQAFAEIYGHYQVPIFRFVSFRVEDQKTAEDVTSVTFLKAWQHLPRFQIREVPFSAWLFRIARNTVIDHYRTSKPQTNIDDVNEHLLVERTQVSEVVEEKLRAIEVTALLGQLTEAQRDVLNLRLFNGLGTSEIARALNKNEGAVRALQMRGLQAIARIREKHEEVYA